MDSSNSLSTIPGVGPKISAMLNDIGIHEVADLKEQDPERLYRKLEKATGAPVDRCVLYVFRCAIYYASHDRHEPARLKWWNWKDPGP
jgi:hypothetical protein